MRQTDKPGFRFDRRQMLVAAAAALGSGRMASAEPEVTQPRVSQSACPLQTIRPVASDGHKGLALLRKPPGKGPFPAVVILHGDIISLPLPALQQLALDAATTCRFLAAGYVVVVSDYRSRNIDPQSPEALTDCLATVEYVHKLPYVDSASLVVYGCSGGGDLTLQVAGKTKLACMIAEEPATMLTSGMFNKATPRGGDVYTPFDSRFMMAKPKQFDKPEFQKILKTKVARIDCPIMIIQGDVDRKEMPINSFNAEILIPELRSSGRKFIVKSYPGQNHCFCMGSGLPPSPIEKMIYSSFPPSWARQARAAFRDMDGFCRMHVKRQPRKLDLALITEVAAS